MRKLLLVACLLSSSALAQERNYSIILMPSELRYIGSLLDEEPAKRSRIIMNKIEGQIAQQDQAATSSFEKQIRDKVAAEEKAATQTPTPESNP